MKKVESIPHYVYQKIVSRGLLQGDILKVDGEFREYFKAFYPAINHSDQETKYVMILTQSCDLVKTPKRKPKLSHVNVCLVRTLKGVIHKLITEEMKPTVVGGENIFQKADLDKLKDRLAKLLNNTDQKTYFFLPKASPFEEDMVALIPLSFSFRTDHYDVLLQGKVLELKPEFQAKVGYIISQLYGRIGTSDLNSLGWNDEKIKNYIKSLLHDFNLVQVRDKSFIEYIQTNHSEYSTIEELIEECDALQTEKNFQPLKNELIQSIRNYLIKSFEDQAHKIHTLQQMNKVDLSKAVQSMLQSALKTT